MRMESKCLIFFKKSWVVEIDDAFKKLGAALGHDWYGFGGD